MLQRREPFYLNSATLLAAAETNRINGFISVHSVTTLFYLLKKGASSADARAILTSLFQIVQIAPVTQSTIEKALNLDYPDFEDAVQMICALEINADMIATRNPRDYQPALVPVLPPVEILAALEGTDSSQ